MYKYLNIFTYVLKLPCCLRIASATTLTPIKTKGTPFPGLVLAPTKCNPETLGVSKLLIPVLVGGLNAANCNSPCDKPNTAPFLMLLSLHPVAGTSSFSIISDSSLCPASRNVETTLRERRRPFPLRRHRNASFCKCRFVLDVRHRTQSSTPRQPSGDDLSVYTGCAIKLCCFGAAKSSGVAGRFHPVSYSPDKKTL